MTETSQNPHRPILSSGEFTIAGKAVHRLGFGAMRITGKGIWGPPADRDEAIAVLRRAVALGVDFIDTADSYGPYVSEELIFEALHPYPENLLIATKAGLCRTGPDAWHPVGRKEYLRQECEMSLRRLGVEQLDLFQLHRIDPKVPLEEQFGLLAALIEEGKVAAVGLSEVSVKDVEGARSIVPISTVQNLFNLVNRSARPLLDYCNREGIGFIPWFPIASGALANPGGAVDAIAEANGVSPAQIALAWLLALAPNVLPIPGTSTVAHVEENCAAATIDLSEDDMARLTAAVS